ncbi:MAG: hypothetical protein JWQ03_605 [Variovorax sp.]|nr:hypothetical protein [Variovorax sp.]
MDDHEDTRQAFEDTVFNRRFQASIQRNAAPPKGFGGLDFVSVGCPTKAELCRRDADGDYVDETVSAMWWGWCAALTSQVKGSSAPSAEPLYGKSFGYSPVIFSTRLKVCYALGIPLVTDDQIVDEVTRLKALATATQGAPSAEPELPEAKVMVRNTDDEPEGGGWIVDCDCEGPLSYSLQANEALYTTDQMREYGQACRAAATQPAPLPAFQRAVHPWVCDPAGPCARPLSCQGRDKCERAAGIQPPTAQAEPPNAMPLIEEYGACRFAEGINYALLHLDGALGPRAPSGEKLAAIRAVLAGAGSEPTPAQGEANFQERVEPWLLACFGPEISGDTVERNHRFLEEALELVQACGCTASEAHQLVDYTFGRAIGEKHQEAGGVMVTLAALCRAQGIDMHEQGEVELARIWTMVEKIRAKQATKPKHSPLPEHAPAGIQGDGKRESGDGGAVCVPTVRQSSNQRDEKE